MLFDLRGRGRQNTVKIVYISLAFLMGGGLVLFGIGGATNGGLVDAITGNGSSGDTGADRFKKQITAAKEDLAADKRDEAAWGTLIRAQVGLAGTDATTDAQTGQPNYTSKGEASLREATASWKQFEAIEPKNKEDEARVASTVVRAYAALNDVEGLVGAQEIVALNRNAVGPYSALAQYAYLAGQTRKGDLASKKALSLEDPDQRQQLKGDLDSYKQQAAAAATPDPNAVQTVTASPSSTATPGTSKGSGKPKAKKGSGKSKKGSGASRTGGKKSKGRK